MKLAAVQNKAITEIPLLPKVVPLVPPLPVAACSTFGTAFILRANGISLEIQDTASDVIIERTLKVMLGDITKAQGIYIVCGYTDMRKSINGLTAIVQTYSGMDPFSRKLFLFCGKQTNKMKALLWEEDGFVLLYKRLEGGKFRWPRTEEQVRDIT